MTTTPTAASGATPQTWVMRRAGDSDEMVPVGGDPASDSQLGFLDFLDVINPLQHLPVVSTIYRSLTGDTISDAARMAGGALYGGPLGLISALANVVVEAETGSDIGGNAMALLDGSGEAGSTVAASGALPATAAEPINAAPVATAAALASPAALAAEHAAAPMPQPAAQVAAQMAGQMAGQSPTQASLHPAARDLSPEAKPAKTDFSGRSADRLDAFIQQASALRRNNPLAAGRGPASPAAAALASANPAAGAIDTARLQAAAIKPPTLAGGKPEERKGQPELSLAGADAGSVNQWMLRALDKYEHMRKQESS